MSIVDRFAKLGYLVSSIPLLLLVSPACAPVVGEAAGEGAQSTRDVPLAITHVDILPMTDEGLRLGELQRDRTVVIRGNRIEAVGSASEVAVPPGARTVEGRGKVLIPGLADMHVHIDHPSELYLYPAYGVTTVLNLRGLPKHLGWRSEIEAEPSIRPTLLTSGDYVDGYPPYMQPMMSFDSPAAAAAAVVAQKKVGFDFVKVYSRLSSEQFEAIGRAAREVGIAVVGHGSRNYSLEQLVKYQANIAHGEELIRWYWDPERPEDSLGEIVETLKGSGTTVTANLNFSRSLIRQKEDLDSLLAQPEARYLHPAIFQPFRRESNRYAARDDAWLERVRRGFEVQRKLIRRLVDSDVVVMAGTDASTAGVYPGYALAEELQEMVSAGLSPLEALRTATRNPGDFVDRYRSGADLPFGRIAEGYRADLVMLERNPLDDIANITAISAVVLRGVVHSRQALRAELRRLDASFEPLRAPIRQLEQHIFAGRIEEAREVFDTAREQHPGAILFSQYVPFFVGYRYLYGEDGYHPDPRRREIALGLYRMYAETYPEFHSAHYLLARAHEANGELEAARASARRALRLHPAYPDARKLLETLEAGPEPGAP